MEEGVLRREFQLDSLSGERSESYLPRDATCAGKPVEKPGFEEAAFDLPLWECMLIFQ